MTNLDRVIKGRDITLPTKVHLFKAMVFPVVMYRCENWTIKKAEHQRTDAFWLPSTCAGDLRGLLMVALRSQGNWWWDGPLGTPLAFTSRKSQCH